MHCFGSAEVKEAFSSAVCETTCRTPRPRPRAGSRGRRILPRTHRVKPCASWAKRTGGALLLLYFSVLCCVMFALWRCSSTWRPTRRSCQHSQWRNCNTYNKGISPMKSPLVKSAARSSTSVLESELARVKGR